MSLPWCSRFLLQCEEGKCGKEKGFPRLYKNIIPNHNRGKPFSFPHLPSSHCSKNLLHHGSDNHRNSESFHIMFSRMRSVSGLMVSLQISKVKQQLAPDYTEETWNEIFKNLLVSKLL